MLSIAVSIAAWKRAEYLDRCLQSLAPQKDPGDELIVVEDGESSYDIPSLALGAGAIYERIPEPRYRCRLNKVINTGANLATADILIITSQDIVFPDGFLDGVRERMAKYEGRKVLLVPHFDTADKGKYGPGSDGTVPNLPAGESTNHWGADRPCVILWKKDFLPFNEEFDNWRGSGTIEWAFRMVKSGAVVVTDPTISCTHVNHGDIAWEQNLVPAGVFLYMQLTGENYSANWSKAG